MSDTENEGSETGECTTEQLFIVTQLQKMPEVLSKSQIPSVKVKKEESIKTIISNYERHVGKPITNQQLLKKINNMKSRLKRKADMKRTGNRKIVLKNWERILFSIIGGEDNPVINKIPGK